MYNKRWSFALCAVAILLAVFALTGCQDNEAVSYAGTYVGTFNNGELNRAKARPTNFTLAIGDSGKVTATFFYGEDAYTMTGMISAGGVLHAERSLNVKDLPSRKIALPTTITGNGKAKGKGKVFSGTMTLGDETSTWEAIPYTGDCPWAGSFSNALDGEAYPGNCTVTVGDDGNVTATGTVTGYGDFQVTGAMSDDGLIEWSLGTVNIAGEGDQPIYFGGNVYVIDGAIVIRGRVEFSFA